MTTLYKVDGTHHLQAVVYSIVEAYGPITLDDIHTRLRMAGNPADAAESIVRLVGAGGIATFDGERWEAIR